MRPRICEHCDSYTGGAEGRCEVNNRVKPWSHTCALWRPGLLEDGDDAEAPVRVETKEAA